MNDDCRCYDEATVPCRLPGHPLQQQQVYTLPQVAEILQISEYRAYELARQGQIPCVRIGRLVRVTAKQLEGFLNGVHPKTKGKVGR